MNKQQTAAEVNETPPNLVHDSTGALREAPTGYRSPYDQDWRVLVGLTITALYLTLMAAYIAAEVGWANFTELSVERMGSFLEGAFAPLAFLWLVIGYFLQKKELRQNTEAMKMQFVEIKRSAEQAELQSEIIILSEKHQRRESFLLIAETVRRQLGSVAGLLFMSSQLAETNEEEIPSERFSELWITAGSSDPEIYSREMLRLFANVSEDYKYKVLYGTEVRTRHSLNFQHSWSRLMDEARDCDQNGIIEDAMMGSAHGRIYQRMLQFRNEPPPGFTFEVYDFDPDTRN